MDPNVQVAIATVVGTAITTLGIVIVALINSRKDDEPDKSEKSSTEMFELVQSLILENARHEKTIAEQAAEIESLRAQNQTKEGAP